MQVVQRYGQWCVHLRCSKLMSRAGGGVYPGFWSISVLAVVICLVALKGKSFVILSLVWGVLSWQELA